MSPELQGRIDDILVYSQELIKLNFKPDAICTKLENFDKWRNYTNSFINNHKNWEQKL